jgi:hypothetical protein
MVKIENHCVGCTDLGLHCIGSHCRNRNVEVHYCDRCGGEIPDGDINEVDGCEYCDDCYDELYEV